MASDVEQLLYHEAHLLDAARYQEWLQLVAEDIRYWAPVRADVYRNQEAETEARRLPLLDETKGSLALRISRLETGFAWVEVPMTRTRRFVSNVFEEAESDGLTRVR